MATQVEVDIFDLKSTISGLQWLYDNIEKQANEMLEEITKNGQKYLDSQYKGATLKDPNITELFTDIKLGNNESEIIARGKDVLYEEFGTGDKGEDNPHPVKSKYDLNDYNSGSYIMDTRDNSNPHLDQFLATQGIYNGKYWTYKKDGVRYYTQGVPSGQEVWNTRNYLIDTEIPKLAKERGKIINDNFIRSIKR